MGSRSGSATRPSDHHHPRSIASRMTRITASISPITAWRHGTWRAHVCASFVEPVIYGVDNLERVCHPALVIEGRDPRPHREVFLSAVRSHCQLPSYGSPL